MIESASVCACKPVSKVTEVSRMRGMAVAQKSKKNQGESQLS